MQKTLFVLCAIAAAGSLAASASRASILIGGDAASQASADTILDIVFVIDTSGSMTDDIAAIGAKAQAAIDNLDCPEIDVWVRARFMGINGTSGTVFNENARTLVDGWNGALAPLTNSTEDNGPIVTDLANWFPFVNDALAGQQYVKAIVTIGDEGTENGSPVDQADYNAAVLANQTAIAKGILLFSWVTNDPTSAQVVPLFQRMAEGGTAPAPFIGAFNNTGGKFINDSAGTQNVEVILEDILCTAAEGGTLLPEPTSCAIWGLGAIACGLIARRRHRVLA